MIYLRSARGIPEVSPRNARAPAAALSALCSALRGPARQPGLARFHPSCRRAVTRRRCQLDPFCPSTAAPSAPALSLWNATGNPPLRDAAQASHEHAIVSPPCSILLHRWRGAAPRTRDIPSSSTPGARGAASTFSPRRCPGGPSASRRGQIPGRRHNSPFSIPIPLPPAPASHGIYKLNDASRVSDISSHCTAAGGTRGEVRHAPGVPGGQGRARRLGGARAAAGGRGDGFTPRCG